MFSGGKDSCYSVWLALHQAWDVERLVTVKPESQDSWMFHYPNVEWTDLQARSMGLPLTLVSTDTDELAQLEETFRRLKVENRLDGVVTGAVASEYQKTRFDQICDRVGLKSFSPLWHKKPETIVDDLVAAGFRIVLAGVAASGLDESWLGKELTPTAWKELKRVSTQFGIHLAGEGGEYETFVVDAPQFSSPISIVESENVWDGQRGHLMIKRASLAKAP